MRLVGLFNGGLAAFKQVVVVSRDIGKERFRKGLRPGVLCKEMIHFEYIVSK